MKEQVRIVYNVCNVGSAMYMYIMYPARSIFFEVVEVTKKVSSSWFFLMIEEDPWPSGLDAGFVIQIFWVLILHPVTRWICVLVVLNHKKRANRSASYQFS